MSSSHVLSEVILTVAAIVLVTTLSLAVFFNLQVFGNNYSGTMDEISQNLKADIKIVYAAKTGNYEAKIWIKNSGKTRFSVNILATSTLIFGPKGNFKVIPYNSSSPPTWNFTIISAFNEDSFWDPYELLEILVLWDSELSSGKYYVRFTVYDGISETYTFTI